MADIYDGLNPTFRAKLPDLEQRCASAGVIVRAYFGLRDPVTQAKLWRQSRVASEVEAVRANLVAQGAPFLAACLDKAGPQSLGPWASNALPGQSWHQWGEAMDYVWIVDGKENWSTTDGGQSNGYQVLARIAGEVGLTSGISFHDIDHVQFRAAGSPMSAGLTYSQIDAAMKAKFGSLIP